ncbi:PREDICTED: uncharacterized protein LOC105150106 [Acromyrmex echinatior]|uniref:TNFR-Cys domain-containing protein n=1 Tax=Acromyrmex echinatior TaxID=103372 RepID=F4W6A6_ACREC|nr:PREDICTED: uncharacterized protein LOC105150106 [Acromyrmex echinatior]XP_011061280.1 PREDICTED: uncharacterized protein LOC105150106 [Acromyrmex echinatior]EGI70241.1 hypothetical protein G5I_01000 [Acromyrmex echinatior]
MPRESCPLLLTLVSIFVGLCESSAAPGAATSGTQQPQPQPQQQPPPQSQQQHPICRPGLEFWSTERASCWPCTRCAPEFTLSPCVIHKDAICGPLSALELDWSFLSSTARKRPSRAGDDDGTVTSNTFLRFSEEKTKERPFVEADNLINPGREGDKEPVSASQESKAAYDPRERRKSAIEDNLPWDWQTGALVLAVCACIVFFLVAGCSAIVYARQWRRMKRNFEPAGLEEISARLNLMVKAELAELVAGAPMNPGDPETRCQYLEKLLDRKRETPVVATAATATAAATAAAAAAAGWPEAATGNLYIEEGGTTTPRSKRSQIARIQRNIETILSHKTNQGD